MPSPPAARTAVLHLRGSPVNHDHERAVVRALKSLSADGLLDDVEVRTWPEKVSFEAESGADYVQQFETFEEWAHEHGMSICPPFVVSDQTSAITRERRKVLNTPVMFLTVYDGDGLAGLYPCVHGDAVTSIDDWLAAFDDSAEREREGSDEEERREARPQRGQR